MDNIPLVSASAYFSDSSMNIADPSSATDGRAALIARHFRLDTSLLAWDDAGKPPSRLARRRGRRLALMASASTA